ncbi:DEAD/DEAH_box family ATP-dependent RNA helicase [Hexamita inflata]|uniref:ATP-dependent RNA helicase n=1 Tax=Hexamita inflata TaxID=28002 RepID=A0AA86NZJ6_9EUKA|nr:DEAD/DEAH box family ATP-dependent RNA helicase [Hexamita inflata]
MKQQLQKYECKQLEQLIKNCEQLNFTNLFQIQQLTLSLNTDQNVFVQAPCGSGKTFAALLPFLLKQEPQIVIYLCTSLNLCKQVSSLIESLTSDIPFFQQHSDFRLIQKPVPTNKSHFIVATPHQLQLFLKQNLIYIQTKTTLVIDEADHQIQNNQVLFNDLFMNLVQRQNLNFNLNNSAYSILQSVNAQKLNYFFMSATLRARESIFNNLNLMPGQLVQIDSMKQNYKSVLIHTHEYFKAFYMMVKMQIIQLPAVVFFEDYQMLSNICLDLLKIQQEETFTINVLMDKWNPMQSGFLNVNQEIADGQLVLATDESARGLDYPILKSAVSIGKTSEEILQHRLGRAGRGDNEGFGFVLGQERKLANVLSQIGGIQIFQNFDQFLTENPCENSNETEAHVARYIEWKKTVKEEETGLYELIQGANQ